ATLFIGVEQGGLLKSTDAGKTFRMIPGMDDDVHRTVINPLNPDRIYITTGIGMYVSSDGGTTWEQWTDLQHEIGGYPDLLVLHPRRPELMFVASAEKGPGSWRKSHFAGSRVSRSTDGGRTWQILRAGLPDRLRPAFEAMCLEDWGDSFSLFAATATGEAWCSDDAGDHWRGGETGRRSGRRRRSPRGPRHLRAGQTARAAAARRRAARGCALRERRADRPARWRRPADASPSRRRPPGCLGACWPPRLRSGSSAPAQLRRSPSSGARVTHCPGSRGPRPAQALEPLP